MSELCKHLPIVVVEQYRRGAYVRYAINSMEDKELHDAARVKTIVDKGGRCKVTRLLLIKVVVAMRVKVILRGWLLFHKLSSNYVLNFHNDAYNMEADMHDFQ